MAKADKLLAKLSQRPAPTDFRWDDLVTLMEHHGFTVTCGGGSHHKFQHASGFTFSAARRHPGGLLMAYDVKNALEAIRRTQMKRI